MQTNDVYTGPSMVDAPRLVLDSRSLYPTLPNRCFHPETENLHPA